MSPWTVEEIASNILLVPYNMPTGNVVSMILARGEKLAVIDTGLADGMPAALEPGLARLGAKLSDIQLIVNTHGHQDHWGGNAAIQTASGAPVWGAAGDVGDFPTRPARLLSEGDVVDLGGLRFEVLALSGHSAGSIGLYEPTLKLLIAADAVQGMGGSGVMPLVFHSFKAYRATLHKVAAHDVQTITLGHPFAWSGERRLVQRGSDVRRFVQDSEGALEHTLEAARLAAVDCPDHDMACLQAALLRRLGQDPATPMPPVLTRTVAAAFEAVGVKPAS